MKLLLQAMAVVSIVQFSEAAFLKGGIAEERQLELTTFENGTDINEMVFNLCQNVGCTCPETEPRSKPTSAPSTPPTSTPSSVPTATPTSAPTSAPTSTPTSTPSSVPTTPPTLAPFFSPAPDTVRAPCNAKQIRLVGFGTRGEDANVTDSWDGNGQAIEVRFRLSDNDTDIDYYPRDLEECGSLNDGGPVVGTRVLRDNFRYCSIEYGQAMRTDNAPLVTIDGPNTLSLGFYESDNGLLPSFDIERSLLTTDWHSEDCRSYSLLFYKPFGADLSSFCYQVAGDDLPSIGTPRCDENFTSPGTDVSNDVYVFGFDVHKE